VRKFIVSSLVLVGLAFGLFFMIGQFSIKPPSPIITVGEKKVEVVQGSYCWEGLINSVCADTVSPPELIKHQGLTPLVISPESKIKIEFKTEPNKNSMGANQWLQNGETENVPLNDNIITTPNKEGVYVYDVFARWDKGDSSYAFVIEVR
jgi:hypothetical protein